MSNQDVKPLSLLEIVPAKSRLRLILVWLIVGLFTVMEDLLVTSLSPSVATLSFLVLLATIMGASFGVVREADELAHKLGEPYGTLILTLSVVTIEVILIGAVMLAPGEAPNIAKDSVFSVMMIILNLVTGLCLLLGGLKFSEQEYNSQGTFTYLGMIIMLGGVGMVLPQFVEGSGSGMFSEPQALVISILVVVLYGLFLFFQMMPYRHLYVQPSKGTMEVLHKDRHAHKVPSMEEGNSQTGSFRREIWVRSVILIAMILPIVLLSGHMAIVVDYGIEAANLPGVLGGLLIATIVFTPESLTAVRAALNNEFQRVINLCHGAFVSTVGLTLPSVLVIGLLTGKKVVLGLHQTELVLFTLTVVLSILSLSGRRTTPMWGVMHLALFVVFVLLIFSP